MTVKVGTTFRSHYADSNPVWQVIKQAGKGIWLAVVTEESEDWAGTEKAFKTAEIEHSISFSKMLAKLDENHNQFYTNLKKDQIVHYHNAFGAFVRCSVVKDGLKTHKLQPIALVGNWDKHDLPSRRINGEIYYPYHPSQIMKMETITPNASNIWENSKNLQQKFPNPINLEVISLVVPEMTAEQAETAKWEQLRDQISDLIRDNKVSGKETIQAVADLLKQSLV